MPLHSLFMLNQIIRTMKDRDFYRLRVVVSNDSELSPIHVEACIKEYFWLSGAYEHEIDKMISTKVREALRIVKVIHMVDVELVKGSTAWMAPETLVDSYRIVRRGYPHILVMSRHNGNTSGAVFNFDNAPVVEVSDIAKVVTRMQKTAYELWKNEWVKEASTF